MKIVRNSFVPLYIQLEELIKVKIQKGEYLYDQPIPSGEEFSKKYGISKITVRQAFNNLVKENLLYGAQGKGTFVKKPVPKLKRYNILISKHSFHQHSFYFDIIRGCEAMDSGETRLSIQTYDEKDEPFSSAIRKPDRDGLLVMELFTPEKNIPALKKTGIPFVLVGHYSLDEDICAVYPNAYRSTFQITEHLAKKGHRKIALLGGNHSKGISARDFLRGYCDALAAHHIPFKSEWCKESNWTAKDGYNLTKELLRLRNLPTAIFAGDDTIAVGVIKALKEKGIRIPQDMAVAGFNDLDLATIVEPHLTTMRIPRFEIGKAAAELLMKLVDGEEVEEKQIVFEPELIIRASSERR